MMNRKTAGLGSGPAEKSDQADGSLVTITFPEKLTPFVVGAMLIGLILIGMVLFAYQASWHLEAQADLLLSAGIAIILAAFGGQATLRGKAYVLAGVAALAVVLFYALEHQRESDREFLERRLALQSGQYVRGYLREIPARTYAVSLSFGSPALGTTEIARRLFTFVVFQSEAQQAEIASLTLDPRVEGEETPPISIGIPASCFTDSMGTNKPLDWELRKTATGFEIVDHRRGDRVVGRFGGERAPSCSSTTAALPPLRAARAPWPASWAAAADEAKPDPAPAFDLKKALDDLKSDNTEIRRSARDLISTASPSQVPAVLAALQADPLTYRTKLGVAVALTQMLRVDKSQNSVIASRINDADRNLLLDMAGDQDRTLRIYASEFLYDLGDPVVAKLAIARAASTADDNARYNWLLVAQDGWRRLTPEEKKAAQTDLVAASSKAGDRTQKLIDALK